jgi:hypothetical protein
MRCYVYLLLFGVRAGDPHFVIERIGELHLGGRLEPKIDWAKIYHF